ncbi:MAG: hypothetical protein DRQ41_06885 [Gammaproteobacteria bacterium]|nr:MAG: hypothetical protein DRQ41_06885 [Gammaproteobacteria bacterium]
MTLKLLILAVLFILSGGAAFSEYFKGHKLLSLLATIVAIIATFYLFQDIYDDLKQPSSSTQSPTVSEIVTTVEPTLQVVNPPEEIPIKVTGDFAPYFQPKQDMFETTTAFQSRRHQLLQQFNAQVKQRNLDYQAGVLRLVHYNADAQTFKVNLDWQAAWVKPFFGKLQNKGTVKVGVKAAKQIYQAGPNKPLFITANLKDNQVEIQGQMVEQGQAYSILLIPFPKMVKIPAGRFRMGDIQGAGNSNEKRIIGVRVKFIRIYSA